MSSAFDCAGGYTFDVVLLQEHEERYNGNCNDHASCGKLSKQVGVRMGTEQHGVQSHRHRPVRCIICTDNDLCEDEVHPRAGETHQRLIDDNRLRKWKNNSLENLEVGASIQFGGFDQRIGNDVKETFGDLEPKAGAGTVGQNQTYNRIAGMTRVAGQADGFQQEINGDHAHETREQADDHGYVL